MFILKLSGRRRTVDGRLRDFLDVDVERHDDPDGDDLRSVVHRRIVHQRHALLVLQPPTTTQVCVCPRADTRSGREITAKSCCHSVTHLFAESRLSAFLAERPEDSDETAHRRRLEAIDETLPNKQRTSSVTRENAHGEHRRSYASVCSHLTHANEARNCFRHIFDQLKLR